MCCGHEDCRGAMLHLDEYLDGELTGAELVEVRRHLQTCAACRDRYGLEQEVRELIARSCGCQAPDQLRARIVAQLTEIRITSTFVWHEGL